MAAFGRCEEEAYEPILGDAGKVFDLGQEKDRAPRALRLLDLGQVVPAGALARRAGRAVDDRTARLGHAQAALPGHAPHAARARPRAVGPASSTSPTAGLLDSTIVRCSGGSPLAQGQSRRGTAGAGTARCSALLAGGGSARRRRRRPTSAAWVAQRPIAPRDVLEVIYARLGIDVAAGLPHPDGTTLPILPPATRGPGSDGPLVELV
ncbi:MAG: hypothetical protein R3F30_04640 [Planctomycetota bacterium]